MVIRALTTTATPKYSFTNVTLPANGGYRVTYLSRDRKTFYARDLNGHAYYSRLNKSTDGGASWTAIRDFSGYSGLSVDVQIQGMVELPDGEVLLGLSAFGTLPAVVWKSSGWAANPATATWTSVLTFPGGTISKQYCLHDGAVGNNGIVVLSESGGQTDSLAARGLTNIAGGTGYTTAILDASGSGGSGENCKASCYNGAVSRIGILNGGTGHTPGTYHFAITGDGVGADWTYTVGAGGSINGVQVSKALNVYLSQDTGATWTSIFNIYETPTFRYGVGVHIHAVAYDIEWNRIWVTFGDIGDGGNIAGFPTNTQIAYSDDLGATWSYLKGFPFLEGNSLYGQYTGIRITNKSVIFAVDAMFDPFVVIYPKSGYRTLSDPVFGPITVTAGSVIGFSPECAYSPNSGFPIFATWGLNIAGVEPRLWTTSDGGFTWDEIWHESDPTTRPGTTSSAITTMCGPDVRNRMLGNYDGYELHIKATLVQNY